MKLKTILPTLAVLMVVATAGCKKETDNSTVLTETSSDLLVSKSGSTGGSLTSPAKDATDVPLNQVITVNFTGKISPELIAKTTFILKAVTTVTENDSDDHGSDDHDSEENDSHHIATVAGTVSYTSSTATFTPSANLLPNTKYKVTVFSSSRDNNHEYHAKKGYSWKFTTGTGTGTTALSVISTDPVNNATGIATNKAIVVTFSVAMNPTTISAATFTVTQGTTAVAGVVTYSGLKATFIPSASLVAGKVYTGTITTGAKDTNGTTLSSNYVFNFTVGAVADITLPTVLSADPLNFATGVAVTKAVAVTFSEAMNPLTLNTGTFTLKQGASNVPGKVSYAGTIATFTPSANLSAATNYTATITSGVTDQAGNALGADFTFSFTTSANADVISPTVLTMVPAMNATSVAFSSNVTAVFSEAMNSSTITSATFTLKQGTTAVNGTVTYAGTTATFTPSAAFAGGTVYTATITTGAKDLAGNAIAVNKSWSFTTATAADVTAPTVGTLVPANGATAVAIASKVTASFSEVMNSSTITTATFTLKQGTITVAGVVSYSGTTATYTPSAALAGSTVYTATITTGAKDLAGNAITVSKVWSFTTAAVAVVCGSGTQSFATMVMPIVQSKCAPCHGASGASAGISLTNYAQVKAIGARLDNPGMYSKMGVDACQIAIIKAWITQGSVNN